MQPVATIVVLAETISLARHDLAGMGRPFFRPSSTSALLRIIGWRSSGVGTNDSAEFLFAVQGHPTRLCGEAGVRIFAPRTGPERISPYSDPPRWRNRGLEERGASRKGNRANSPGIRGPYRPDGLPHWLTRISPD